MPWSDTRTEVLAEILPAGTSRYVALFQGDPTDGGVEVTSLGYERVDFDDWVTAPDGDYESVRSNASSIVFPPSEQGGSATHWAIFDVPGAGNMKASGRVRDEFGDAYEMTWTDAGDELRLPIGALRIRARHVIEED
jgi:hypothetical protein